MSEQDFLEKTSEEYEQTKTELREIELLIQQSGSEVERLAQQNVQVSNYIQQLQSNFETLPRADIKEAYEAYANAQKRLFTMRGQLEKLQSDRRNLSRLAEAQEMVLQLGSSGTTFSNPSDSSSNNSMASASGGDLSNVIRIISAQESERQSLVKRMHDGPASSLSNFILQAEICQRFFESDPERARTELNALKSAAAKTFGAVKNFIFDLRPMMLDDLGVVPTLRRYTESFQEQNEIPVSLSVTGMERRLESHIEVTVFRGVQELLNNAKQHSQATQLQVQVDMGQDEVIASVEDNGRGLNAADVFSDNSKETIGLPAIRERVTVLGGNFDIQSSIGQGTRIEFSVPALNQEDENL